MKRWNIQPSHVLRFFSMGLLLVVLLVIALDFIARSQRQLRIPEASSSIEGQRIDKKEEVKFREIRKNKESTIFSADRHYIGEDNLYHLEGNVELSFPNRIEGGDITLRGGEILHDKEWSYLWLRDGGVVQFKDLTIESPVLEFDVKENMFSSDQGIQFTSGTISGSARKCTYDLDKKKAQLSEEVHLELQTSREDSLPLKVDAGFFEYFIGKGKGRAEKDVELVHGKSHATAGLLRFELAANREKFKSLLLKEKVRITLIEEFGEDEPLSRQDAFPLYSERCEMEASEISIRGFVDIPQVQSLEAEGSCCFRFISEDGSSTQLEGKRISFLLSQKGRLKKLSVLENAKITEEDKDGTSSRYIEGQALSIEEDKNTLRIDGSEAAKARIRSKNSEITSPQITINLKTNDLETETETEVILYPEETSSERFGFFSSKNPVFITADTMRYFEEDQRFVFSEKVKLWQVKEMFLAQEVSMDIETGAVQAEDGVQSVFPYQPKDKNEEERIRIESSHMEFDPEKNDIIYSGGVTLKMKDLSIKCQTLTTSLDIESREMVGMVARTQVVILQKTYEGRGEEARFDVKEEIIQVTGNPVFIDKERGKTEGAKLTFYMADDRIVIENRDGERSTTVIK